MKGTENLDIPASTKMILGFIYLSNAKENLDIAAGENLTLGFIYLMPRKIWT